MPKTRLLPFSLSTSHRWTEDEARAVLTAQNASGLSVAAFAAREGLVPERVYYWRRRLECSVEATPAPVFVEVRPPAERELVEVLLRCGRVVRVTEAITPSVLRRLVDALDQDSAC
jgi:transposase-like protein